MPNWKIALRWLAVVPSAFGGLLVGSIVISLFGMFQTWFIGGSFDSGYLKIFYWAISSFAGGALAVYWGVKVAPGHHRITSAVIAALVLVFAVVGFIFPIPGEGWFWPLVSAASMSLGAGYVMHKVYDEGQDFDLFG